MRPGILLAAGGAAAAVSAILLMTRKARAATPAAAAPGFDPTQIYGETRKVALAVPSGWRRATTSDVNALPELRDQANALRSAPGFTSMAYGTLTPFTASDGKTYATWIEQHYHEPGGPVKPWGLHHGVTLLAQAGTLSDEWPGVRPKILR